MSADSRDPRAHHVALREQIRLSHLLLDQRAKFVTEFVGSNNDLIARTSEVIAESVLLLQRFAADGFKQQCGHTPPPPSPVSLPSRSGRAAATG